MPPKALGPVVPKPFLNQLLGAFTRRRKAIKYHVQDFSLELDSETVDDEEEGLQLQLVRVQVTQLGARGTRVSFHVWEDGEAWLLLCKAEPKRIGGWFFNETFRGSVEELSGSQIVELFEKTLFIGSSSSSGSDLRQRITEVWQGAFR